MKFRAGGRKKEAMIAFEKSAEANEASSNEWHAGKHLETCALLAKEVGGPAEVAVGAGQTLPATSSNTFWTIVSWLD